MSSAHARAQTQSLEVAFVDLTVFELDSLQIVYERPVNLLLRGAILPHLFKGRARVVCEGRDGIPVCGLLYRGDARGGVELLVGPEAPADIVAFEQPAEGGYPLVRVLA